MAVGVILALVISIVACILGFVFGQTRARKAMARERERLIAPKGPVADAIVHEQLSRNVSFFGEEAVTAQRKAFVVIVGVGGVGSHAADLLVRSGVGRVRLVDYDQVSVSSLNRHACATREEVGLGKAQSMAKHFRKIFPHANIEVEKRVFRAADADVLLRGSPDWVLDCIDNTVTKAELILYCRANGLQVISSMGAGARMDPTKVVIGDISETANDPLARTIRTMLKAKGVRNGIPCVYTSEPPQAQLQPLELAADEEAEDYRLLPQFRTGIMPVFGPLPALFGATMAAYVLVRLSGDSKSLKPLPLKESGQTLTKMYSESCGHETKYHGAQAEDFAFSRADVNVALSEMYNGRSAVSGKLKSLVLRRWRMDEPLTLSNCVVLTKAEAKAHCCGGKAPPQYDADVVRRIEAALKVYERMQRNCVRLQGLYAHADSSK